MIRIVYGNGFSLAIPLTLRTATLSNGSTVTTDADFVPTGDVKVLLSSGASNTAYTATMNSNVATITDSGTLKRGTYNVTVLCKDSDGRLMRFKMRNALEIVDVTQDAGIEAGVEFDATTYTLEALVALAGGGSIAEEVDPIFTASPAYGITAEDIARWNSSTGGSGYVITFDDGNVIFEESGAQPTFDDGNVIF